MARADWRAPGRARIGRVRELLRGEVKGNVPARPARVVDATGAGDALLGVLVARLAQTDFYPSALVLGLKEAVEEAARTVERYGP